MRKNPPLRPIRTMVDEILKQLSPQFHKMYAKVRRPSIPSERLLRAQRLQMLYSARNERPLMEEKDYNILFRWFVGLNLDDPVWDATVFTKKRDGLLKAEVAKEFLVRVVGQARARSGRIFTGCNVKNTTYGLTLCAERVAVFKAISEGERGFDAVAIVADTDALTPPCGSCRQILWEFCGDAEVALANLLGKIEGCRMSELLPKPFDGSFL